MDGYSPNEVFFPHDVEKRRIIILSSSSFPFMRHENVCVTSSLAWQVLRGFLFVVVVVVVSFFITIFLFLFLYVSFIFVNLSFSIFL